jgi:hypothetical protein
MYPNHMIKLRQSNFANNVMKSLPDILDYELYVGIITC